MYSIHASKGRYRVMSTRPGYARSLATTTAVTAVDSPALAEQIAHDLTQLDSGLLSACADGRLPATLTLKTAEPGEQAEPAAADAQATGTPADGHRYMHNLLAALRDTLQGSSEAVRASVDTYLGQLRDQVELEFSTLSSTRAVLARHVVPPVNIIEVTLAACDCGCVYWPDGTTSGYLDRYLAQPIALENGGLCEEPDCECHATPKQFGPAELLAG